MMLKKRYELCRMQNAELVFINVPRTGYQLPHYTAKGFKTLGEMDVNKIAWGLGASVLMAKELS